MLRAGAGEYELEYTVEEKHRHDAILEIAHNPLVDLISKL